MPSSAWPSLLAAFPLFLGSPPPEPRLPLPAAREGIVFAPETSEVSLDFLLAELARTTGQELALGTLARKELARERIALVRTDPVPPEDVYAFVESLIAPQGGLIAPLTGGARPVLGVYFPGRRNASPSMLEPLTLSSSLFDEAERHPALFVRVLLVLKNTDARQLQTQLRQLFVDPTGANNVVPAGERGLLLQGRAAFLVGLARQILEMDAAVGRGEPATLPAIQATEGVR